MRSVYDSILSKFTFRPAAVTATANGTAVNTAGFNSAVLALEVGAVTGTAPTLDVKVQESVDGSTGWVDVTGATLTQVVASNNSQVLRVEGLGTSRKQYLRAVATIAGTTPSFTFGASISLGRAYVNPVQ